MKNILIPTDFSACADFAVDAGIQLAERFDTQVHLLHCLPAQKTWQKKDPNAQLERSKAIKNAETLLASTVKEHPNLSFTTKITSGKLPIEVAAYAEQVNVDLVVMGSHGASGRSEYLIGSNTQKVVRKIHLPVLVIKDKLANLNFEKVVFATNLNQEEKEAFARFKDFVKHFLPEIHIVYINNDPFFGLPYVHTKEILEEWKVLAKPFECKTHYFSAYTIDQGIRALSEDIGAHLVCISNHQRHPMKRMFAGSNVEALVNHSNLPVLSIDY